MIGIRPLTINNAIAQVEFCAIGFDCVLTAGIFLVTASLLPDELFSGLRAGKMHSAQCNNIRRVLLRSGLGHVFGLGHFLNI